MKLYQALASAIVARLNCIENNNQGWELKHEEKINKLVAELPSGSGFDSGTSIDLNSCNENKIVLNTDYHHMDDNGSYDGWTSHTIIVRPSFDGVRLTISGKDRNEIKEYMYDCFYADLTKEV